MKVSINYTHPIWRLTSKLCRLQAEVIQNHENEHVHIIGHGEARHKKYKGLKFGSGQAYYRSNDQAAVVA
jgi:hypothetical protein